jgi:hypoxanthine phosphoribosyltransferase
MSTSTLIGQLRPVIAAEQIQKRVKEMARQISDDYRGQTVHALAVLENGFMFMSDLVRVLDTAVICTFIKGSMCCSLKG